MAVVTRNATLLGPWPLRFLVTIAVVIRNLRQTGPSRVKFLVTTAGPTKHALAFFCLPTSRSPHPQLPLLPAPPTALMRERLQWHPACHLLARTPTRALRYILAFLYFVLKMVFCIRPVASFAFYMFDRAWSVERRVLLLLPGVQPVNLSERR